MQKNDTRQVIDSATKICLTPRPTTTVATPHSQKKRPTIFDEIFSRPCVSIVVPWLNWSWPRQPCNVMSSILLITAATPDQLNPDRQLPITSLLPPGIPSGHWSRRSLLLHVPHPFGFHSHHPSTFWFCPFIRVPTEHNRPVPWKDPTRYNHPPFAIHPAVSRFPSGWRGRKSIGPPTAWWFL